MDYKDEIQSLIKRINNQDNEINILKNQIAKIIKKQNEKGIVEEALERMMRTGRK